MSYLVLAALIAASTHAAILAHRKAEVERLKRLALHHWNRQQQDLHPWQRHEPWVGMEEAHKPRWTRKLKLVVKDTWAKEQGRAVFRKSRRID